MADVFGCVGWMRIVLIVSFCCSVLTAANAGEMESFRTPSGNVHCMFLEGTREYPANLRCDIMQIDGSLPSRPRDCDLEYGRSFGVSQGDSNGQLLCVGDAVFNDNNPALQYGQIWQRAGFTCTSAENGLSCFNANRHGFFLSRGSRKVF
jgi:hypothetical protein